LLVVFLTGILTVGLAAPARADEDINAVLKKISDLERAIQVSRQNAARYQQAQSQYQRAVAAANSRIATLANQEQNAQSEAEAVSADIAISEEQLALLTLQLNETVAYAQSLDAAIDEGAKRLVQREDLYGQHLRQVYRQYRVTPIEMLLSSANLADFAQRVQLLLLVARQDQQLVSEIKRLKSDNEDKRVTAGLKQAEIDGLKSATNQQRETLTAKRIYLDQLIAQTSAAKSATAAARDKAAGAATDAAQAAKTEQARAEELQRQRAAAEQLYTQLAAQVAGRYGLNKPYPGGKLVQWPVSGSISSYFGNRCFVLYGRRYCDFHTGLDIAAPMYTPVRAAAPGVVQYVGYETYGAMIVIIGHYSNFQTEYVHLDNRARPPVVQAGQTVAAGQVIAYIGMTGLTTGPHLHFMTILNKTPVNPLPYLP
jgi:murein DD-endopeptidase MepM/ murein hydrolase activator NlpD